MPSFIIGVYMTDFREGNVSAPLICELPQKDLSRAGLRTKAERSLREKCPNTEYFPVFGLNTDIYGVNLGIQLEYRKIRTRKNFVFGHFFTVDGSTKDNFL